VRGQELRDRPAVAREAELHRWRNDSTKPAIDSCATSSQMRFTSSVKSFSV
jgi:hypothetical protein